MGKTFRTGTLTREQQIKIERSARRQVDIEEGIPHFKHKVHKTAKTYNRSENKKIEW
jgi:hypothetical protein